MDNLREEAIENTAKKCSLTNAVVSRIIKEQYNYIAFRARNLEEVKIKSFGTWMIKPSKRKEVIEKLNNPTDGTEKMVTI